MRSGEQHPERRANCDAINLCILPSRRRRAGPVPRSRTHPPPTNVLELVACAPLRVALVNVLT